MRRSLTLSLLLLAAASQAELYGVKLYSWTYASTTTGTGTTAPGGGVTMTGLIAGEVSTATAGSLPPNAPYGTPIPWGYQFGTATLSAEAKIYVFWLDGPPAELYLNRWDSGNATAMASRSTPGGIGKVSASAPTGGAYADTRYTPPPQPLAINVQSSWAGWQKSSWKLQNVTWTPVGVLGTRTIYRTVDPITVAMSGVSVDGSASATGATATSLGVAAAGYGYFFADHPWP